MANAETLFTASRSPPSVSSSSRVDQWWRGGQDHARSRTVDTPQPTRNRNAVRLEFPLVPLTPLLARASAIGNSRFYVSLFVAVPRAESNSNRCPRGHSQKLQGMREGGNGVGNVEGNRALRESKGEFLLFIYELFIRLVELSLAPTFLSFSLTSSLVLSMNANANSDGEKETEEMGKRVESTRGGTPSPERVPEISRLPGAKKSDIFPR